MSADHSSPPPSPPKPPSSPMMKYWDTPPKPPGAPRQGYRPGKSDGVLIAWTVLCGLWWLALLIDNPDNGRVAFAVIFVVWAIPAFWLTIIYLVARAGRRRCPVCGTHVKTGRTECAGCGHNFALAAHR